MIDTSLMGKVAVVTGANHGIGAATAKALAVEGAAVFITYLRVPTPASIPGDAPYTRNRAGAADAVVQAIRDRGGRIEAWEADLADPATVPQLFDRAEAAFGPVEVLVNNAAHWESDTFIPQPGAHSGGLPEASTHRAPLPLTPESHDRHFAVNSRAVALMMAEFARRHVERGANWGRIINISTDGASGFSGEISYGASKHALESYSRAAASELKRYGITVNIASLGPIQTGYITPEMEAQLDGYVGQPEDVADVIVFLASNQARWVTGQLIYVGGGHVMPL
jgi:3-oxoacyl-[acyl-carrier protein] reductase